MVANTAPTYGGKANSLRLLREWDLPVPDFICIDASILEHVLLDLAEPELLSWLKKPLSNLPVSFEKIIEHISASTIPNGLAQTLKAFQKEHPDAHFAVRSSATLEDGEDASFAGLFETVLNVKSYADIAQAIKQCWSSLFTERVHGYMRDKALDAPLGMALVVQVLVPAEKSGVLFTVDPVAGLDKQMLIEACFGLGEALVSGQVTPDQYHYNWYEKELSHRVISEKDVQCVRLPHAPFVKLEPLSKSQSTKAVLDITEVETLANMALQIQTLAGHPVDIEWAFHAGQCYILQSRPITQMGFAAIPGEWTTADFRDGGVSASVCTPLMASLYKYVMDASMPAHMRKISLLGAEGTVDWMETFFGRPYWNLQAVKDSMLRVPGFKEHHFDEGLGIVPRYEGTGRTSRTTPKTIINGLQTLWGIHKGKTQTLKSLPGFATKQGARLKELSDLNTQAMDDVEFFAFYDTFIQNEYYETENTYFDFIYFNSHINSFFKETLTKLGVDMSALPNLLSGLSNLSHVQPVNEMWAIRDQIKQSPNATTYWEQDAETLATALSQGDMPMGEAVQKYLSRFGYHSRKELDLTVPRYDEDVAYVIKQIQEFVAQPDDFSPVERNEKQSRQARQAGLDLLEKLPKRHQKKLSAKLTEVRLFLWWREELRDLSTHYYAYVRRFTLQCEARLLRASLLEKGGDIFFLDKDSLLRFLKKEIPTKDLRALVEKNKAYYQSFAKYEIPDELGSRYSGPAPELSNDQDLGEYDFKGIAGSPGNITGVARVIKDIDDAGRLQSGDILVTRCTDPGWTSKFCLLSGVVTETGGILSHAAVICREYGIPAILAVKRATTEIKDGQTITLNGSLGTVILVEGPPPQEAKE